MGRTIAATSCVEANGSEPHLCVGSDVYVFGPDGTQLINLSKNGIARVKPADGGSLFNGYFYGVSWSPDSQYVAYDNGVSVYLSDIGGRGARPITQGIAPAWQPTVPSN